VLRCAHDGPSYVRTGPAETSTGTLRAIDSATTNRASTLRHPLPSVALLVGLLALIAAACSTGDSSTSMVAEPDPAGEDTTGGESTGEDQTSAESDPAETPVGPPTVEAVTYPSGDLQLEGDLHLPASPGPHPAVVLIHGSGPISRHAALPGQLAMQFGFSIPVFDELARALADAGWVVLTYDKRSCGMFNGCAENSYPLPDDSLTTDTFAADAQAGVEYLRTRDEVNPEAVTVAGHSQGSTFVPGLLRDDPRLRAGIMLAAPFDSIDQVLADQAAFVAEILGPGAADTPAVTQANDLAAQVAALRADPAATDAVGGASAAFWRSWMDVGDAAPTVIAEVTQPVFLLFGGNDWNVPVDQAAKWRTAAAGLDHVQLAAIECTTHALNCVNESDPAKITPADTGRNVDPTVPASLIEFLTES
jgi:hypothetical protein